MSSPGSKHKKMIQLEFAISHGNKHAGKYCSLFLVPAKLYMVCLEAHHLTLCDTLGKASGQLKPCNTKISETDVTRRIIIELLGNDHIVIALIL